jgi:hypothetical protein
VRGSAAHEKVLAVSAQLEAEQIEISRVVTRRGQRPGICVTPRVGDDRTTSDRLAGRCGDRRDEDEGGHRDCQAPSKRHHGRKVP